MSEFQETSSYLDVESALADFADKLLKHGVAHTEVWKRAVFRVPPENQAALMTTLHQSSVGGLLIQPGVPIPYFEEPGELPIIASERPAGIAIVVEDFDHRASRGWRETSVDFCLTYLNEAKDDYAQVQIKHLLGRHSVDRLVMMPRYAETGYEGHGFETQPVTPQELQAFFGLLTTYLGPQLPEESFSDLYKRVVYVDVDTEERFYYDEAAKTHISSRGVSTEEYKSPLNQLDDEVDPERRKSSLIETERFRIEYLNDIPEV
jgi:hypothetical protein